MTDKQILSLVHALKGVGYSIISAGLLIAIALSDDLIRIVFMFVLSGHILVCSGDDKKQDEE